MSRYLEGPVPKPSPCVDILLLVQHKMECAAELVVLSLDMVAGSQSDQVVECRTRNRVLNSTSVFIVDSAISSARGRAKGYIPSPAPAPLPVSQIWSDRSCSRSSKIASIWSISSTFGKFSITRSKGTSPACIEYQGRDLKPLLRAFDSYPECKSKIIAAILRCCYYSKVSSNILKSEDVYTHMVDQLTEMDYRRLIVDILRHGLARETSRHVPRLTTSKFPRDIEMFAHDTKDILGEGPQIVAVSRPPPPSYEDTDGTSSFMIQTAPQAPMLSENLQYTYSRPQSTLDRLTAMSRGVVCAELLEIGVVPIGTWVFLAESNSAPSTSPPVELVCTTPAQKQDVINKIALVEDQAVTFEYGDVFVLESSDMQWVIYTTPSHPKVIPYMMLSTDRVFMTKSIDLVVFGMPSYHLARICGVALSSSFPEELLSRPALARVVARKVEICLTHVKILTELSQLDYIQTIFPGVVAEVL